MEKNVLHVLDGLAKGDSASFKSIYKHYWKRLYHIAFHLLQSEHDAEDVVQEVFSSIWYRRESINIKTGLENYLVKATKYTAYFHLKLRLKKQALELENPVSVNDVESRVECGELAAMVDNLLASLPHKTSRIFSLSRFEGMTYPQIAEVMGLSVKSIEYHISIALKKFSRELVYLLPIFYTAFRIMN